MTTSLLTSSEVQTALSTLAHWVQKGSGLQCNATFKDFREAFGFLTQAALVSERLNHHPEWSNCYNKVSIFLCTHDSGGITEKDITWARLVSEWLPT